MSKIDESVLERPGIGMVLSCNNLKSVMQIMQSKLPAMTAVVVAMARMIWRQSICSRDNRLG
jgi:hypothetical protein